MIMEVVNLSHTTEFILNVHCLLTLWEAAHFLAMRYYAFIWVIIQ
jgi:hypothetical protein